MKLFISPHNDDEVLFGCFTLQREQPLVVVVTDSHRQLAKGITAERRRAETRAAARLLGLDVRFLGIPDARLPFVNWWTQLPDGADEIWMPAWETDGNADHNRIAEWLPPGQIRVTRYMTYTTRGKSTGMRSVPSTPEQVLVKLRALACYESQILEPTTTEHFTRDQREWYQTI